MDCNLIRSVTLRIEARTRDKLVVLALSGRLDASMIPELERLTSQNTRPIVLDLKEVSLIDREGVRFLLQCETNGIVFDNCTPYIREWLDREKD